MFGILMQGTTQSVALASVSANIVSATGVSRTADMDFGAISANEIAKTFVLSYNDMSWRETGTLSLERNDLQSVAVFSVGDAGSCFDVTISCTSVLLSGPFSQMLWIDKIEHKVEMPLGEAGPALLKLKAALNVPAKTVAGSYKPIMSGDDAFAVTVNYN